MVYRTRGIDVCLAALCFSIQAGNCTPAPCSGEACSAEVEHGPASLIQKSSAMALSKLHVAADLNSEPASRSHLMSLLLTARDKVVDGAESNASHPTDGSRRPGDLALFVGSEFAAKPIAAMMISAIILICVIFGMTHSRNDRLANVTFLAVDNFLAVFVAVLWFQALHTEIMFLKGTHSRVLASAMHSVCCLMFMVALAWCVSRKPTSLATVATVGGYIIAFSSTHTAYMSQKYNFSQHWLQCVIGIVVLMMVMFILAVVFHFVWASLFHERGVESAEKHVNDWAETAETMENDFWAMPVAVAIVELVHFSISGDFPEIRGTNLRFWNTHDQRMKFLVFCLVLLTLSLILIPCLKRMQQHMQRPYAQRRTLGFICTLLAMSVAWAFIDLGQWEMYEEFESAPIFARIMYANICTAVGLLGMCILSLPGCGRMSMRLTDVVIRTLSLVVAWSWQQVLDITLENALYKELTKPLVALVVGMVIVPFMVIYTKPDVLSIKKLYA